MPGTVCTLHTWLPGEPLPPEVDADHVVLQGLCESCNFQEFPVLSFLSSWVFKSLPLPAREKLGPQPLLTDVKTFPPQTALCLESSFHGGNICGPFSD